MIFQAFENNISNIFIQVRSRGDALYKSKIVNELTLDLFTAASTPDELVKLGEKQIYEFIKQLWLSKTKAKNQSKDFCSQRDEISKIEVS